MAGFSFIVPGFISFSPDGFFMRHLIHISIDFNCVFVPSQPLLHLATVSFLSDGSFMRHLIHIGVDFNRTFVPSWPLLYLATVSFPSDSSFMRHLIHHGVDFNPSWPMLHTYPTAVSFPFNGSFIPPSFQPRFQSPTAAPLPSPTFIPFPWQIFIPLCLYFNCSFHSFPATASLLARHSSR